MWKALMVETRTLLTGLAAAALLSAAPAVAGEAGNAAKADPSEKMVCKNRARTGTRFATKICRTMAQWDLMAVENQRAMKETVDRPQIKVCGPSGCE